jgi:hypothetical protein
MGKQITKKILDCKLIKVEKLYNQSDKNNFFYNLQLEEIDDLLLVESKVPFEPNLKGHKIRYELNDDNEVCNFDFL